MRRNHRRGLALHWRSQVVLSYVNPWIEHDLKGGEHVSVRKMFRQKRPYAQQSVPLLRAGGVRLVVYSHGNNIPARLTGPAEVEYMVRCFDALVIEAGSNPDTRLVLTRRDLDRALAARKLGILLHMTGSPIHGDLAVLRGYARLGLRAAHPFLNDERVGGYAGGDRRVGLRPLGRAIVREMERIGMLLDLTHANDRCFRDVMRMVTRPVIDSHTCCRSLVDLERNRTDEQFREIARTGGVVGVHFSSKLIRGPRTATSLLRERFMKGFRRKLAVMERRYPNPYEFLKHRYDPLEWPKILGGAVEDGTKIERATVGQVVDQLDRMVEVAGIDHVGVGTDYDNGDGCEINRADKLPMLTGELLRRGYRTEEVRKILGGNFLRVFRQCLPSEAA